MSQQVGPQSSPSQCVPSTHAPRMFTRPSSALQWSALLWTLLQIGPIFAQSNVHWITIEGCPVMFDKSVEVPAKEAGQLEHIAIELNATVRAGQLLASLDHELATMELKIAKLQHTAAMEHAADDSQVTYHQLELKAAEEDLENHTAISKSVAASELRRKRLEVARAGVQLQTAQRALKRAATQAELSAAAVQAASLRVDNRQIVAPIDGIVTAIMTNKGQWIEAGKSVMVISDLRYLQVDCLIPFEKVDIRKVEDLEVRIEYVHRRVQSQPVRLAGRIISYDPKLNSQGEVRVHARIQNVQRDGHWLLLPGMTVNLQVAVPSESSPALISKGPESSSTPAPR